MFTLLRYIIFRNWKLLATLFFVTLFSGVGFITLGQLTENIQSSVAAETRPLFGADVIISPNSYTGESLYEQIQSYLSGEVYTWAERKEFSTTLIDHAGKTGLVKVIAYRGTYPQRGVLKTTPLIGSEKTENLSVSATPELIKRFGSGQKISLDGKNIRITDRIIESSDIGLSLGTENHLLILPTELLSGSMLLSSGSRLDHDLLISIDDASRAKSIKKSLERIFPKEVLRIRTYEERSERNLETVGELTNYILLILVVSSIFALVILKSAHDAFFDNLSRTLRIIEILGFTRKRQMILFIVLYLFLIPLALLLAGTIGYGIIEYIATIPEASSFEWKWNAFLTSLILLGLLIFAAFFGVWKQRWIAPLLDLPSHRTESTPRSIKTLIRNGQKILSNRSGWIIFFTSIPFVYFITGMTILWIIFENIFFAISIIILSGVVLLLISSGLHILYARIFQQSQDLKQHHFVWYDGIRTLIRPLTPTIPITISLVSITTFFLIFILFSLSFRSELSIDTKESANIYALNILETDREKIQKIASGSEMYSILRARIVGINGKTLSEYLGTDRPSGEFTREFNITDTPLQDTILSGKHTIEKQEVSIDDAFAKRLGVTIGDRIEFLLSGKRIFLTIANIRESTRQGFRPFFYFLVHAEEFRNAPKTYFLSTYTNNLEAWKQLVLENSGPHVTFIDVESILSVVRSIAEKILAIIGLFLTIISIFSFFAILSFFSRMHPIEKIKKRLYTLFGMHRTGVGKSLQISRWILFLVSWILSILLAFMITYFLFRSSTILSFSWSITLLTLLGSIVVYLILMTLLRPKQ